MTARVIATAGHVDHGKSTLVQALTGIDPDRWAEEKARGMTIDLGFADMALPRGGRVSFVDVPGHIRFLRNMLAGTGAVDACLFVVAATEGWKEQSEEHLRILDVLGYRAGVIALTKRALVEPARLRDVHAEIAERVTGSFLANAPIIPVDALAGTGLDALTDAIEAMLGTLAAPVDHGRPRLWIDRCFAVAGAGTVVTGTLTGGSVKVGEELELWPAGTEVRVRGAQTHHLSVVVAEPGARTALNLVGVHHRDVARGDVLVRSGDWHRTSIADASLEVLDHVRRPVTRRGAYLAYVGSSELAVQLRVLGSGQIRPGERGSVRLHLPRPLPLVPGDRYVLRDVGRQQTIGGGEILDVDPILPAARAQPDRSVERVIAERGWVDVGELRRLTGTYREPDVGRWCVAPAALASARAGLEAAMAAAGPLGLDLTTLDERERALIDTMVASGAVSVRHGRARPATGAGTGEPSDPLADHPFLAAVRAEPFRPPAPGPGDRAAARELVRRGLLVDCGGVFFSPAAVDEARRRIADLFLDSQEGVTLAAVRDALGTSRRYALALLEHLDARGETRRCGDQRVPGPRWASAESVPTRTSLFVD